MKLSVIYPVNVMKNEPIKKSQETVPVPVIRLLAGHETGNIATVCIEEAGDGIP